MRHRFLTVSRLSNYLKLSMGWFVEILLTKAHRFSHARLKRFHLKYPRFEPSIKYGINKLVLIRPLTHVLPLFPQPPNYGKDVDLRVFDLLRSHLLSNQQNRINDRNAASSTSNATLAMY